MPWSDLVKGEKGDTGAAGTGIGDVDTVQTLDATPTTIRTIPLTTDTVTQIVVDVVGIKSDKTAISGFKKIVTYKNDSGVLTLQGMISRVHQQRQAGWDVTFSISGANVLLQVTGAAMTIDWKSNTWTLEV